MKALVIGGGIAGPVTALALQKAGMDAVVFEAYDTTADGVGGMLTVAPNGLAALKIVGLESDFGDPLRHIDVGTLNFSLARLCARGLVPSKGVIILLCRDDALFFGILPKYMG